MSSEGDEELAIIRSPDFGMRDCNQVVLWFDVETIRGNALQVIEAKEAIKLIQEAHVYRIKDLDGKACAVVRDRGLIKFKRVL